MKGWGEIFLVKWDHFFSGLPRYARNDDAVSILVLQLLSKDP